MPRLLGASPCIREVIGNARDGPPTGVDGACDSPTARPPELAVPATTRAPAERPGPSKRREGRDAQVRAAAPMQPAQRVLVNTSLMFAKQAIMAVLGVVFIGYVARKLSVAAWGELQASFAISSVLAVAAGMGVRGYLGRETAIHPEEGASHLASALVIRGVLGAVLLGGMAIVGLVASPGLNRLLLPIAAASQIANLFYSTMWLSFEAHERMKYILYVELAARLFVIAVATALLVSGHGVVSVAATFAVGNGLELLLTYYFVHTRLYRPKLEAKLAELARITLRSLPIGMCGALIVVQAQTEKVLLRLLSSEEAVGRYSAASVLSENFTMIVDSFMTAAFAAGMRLRTQDARAFGRLYETCLVVALSVGLPIAAGTGLLAPEIMTLLYRGRYDTSAVVLQVLALQLPLAFAFQVGSLPLLAERRERLLASMLGGLVLAKTVGSLLLVPKYGPLGAALAGLFAWVVVLTASCIAVSRWVLAVSLRKVAAAFGATALMSPVAWAAAASYGMWASIGSAVPTYLALLLAFRVVTREELFELLRRKPRLGAEPAAAAREATTQ